MEAAPPSYEKATLIDYWDIIARYMPSNDLCSASLVCSRWHTTFAPYLWGNPASHFGLENDRVYVALTKFKRTLQTARLLVRSMTHTLHLPPAHAEIYYGPHADWLRDTLDRLPNLQTLIVRSLPFFDHAALQRLKQPDKRHVAVDPSQPALNGIFELPGSAANVFQPPPGVVPSFGLRLLDASRCSNVTSHGLALALKRFENLLYLDLSFTYPARETIVLTALRRFAGLQVLKLRGIQLKDENLQTLAESICLRVRSLDIRDNKITDRGVRVLLENCFAPLEALHGTTSAGNRSPALLPYLGSEVLKIYQGPDFEGYMRSMFTGGFVNRLAIEDVPEGGITHLYIANNPITVEGVSGLARCRRLHVLDVGSLGADVARHPSVSWNNDEDADLFMPGMEKLTPILASHAAEGMSFLRIDHSLVTKDAPNPHPEEVISGRVELADTALPVMPPSNIAELPAISIRGDVFEMSAEPSTPRAELEGDPLHIVVSPAAERAADVAAVSDEKEVVYPQARRGSAIAPEVAPYEGRRGSAAAPQPIDTLTTDTSCMNLLSPVSALEDGVGTMMTFHGGVSPIASTPPEPGLSPVLQTMRPRSYSSATDQRKARLNAHKTQNHCLHPAMLPKLKTLILTNVPGQSWSKDEGERLIRFVRLCAEESQLAMTQAKYDYSLPPGRKGQAAALRQSAEKNFALKRIVLEIAPDELVRRNSKASPWQHTTGKSMTEDRDSEALWNAAETDFSFFGDEEDSSFPSIACGRFALHSSDKASSFGAAPRYDQQRSPSPVEQPPPKFDNIAMLSAFRHDRKVAHQRNLAAGAVEPETEGYWDGLIQVIRPQQGTRHREDEELDYYGNAFMGGYLYR